MDIIRLKNMEFYGHTGYYPEEEDKGQRFVISGEIFYENIRAKVTDDLRDTCDYSLIYSKIKDIVESDRSDLIEHLAYVIAGEVLYAAQGALRTIVTVGKPECPIEGSFETMEVTVTRDRGE